MRPDWPDHGTTTATGAIPARPFRAGRYRWLVAVVAVLAVVGAACAQTAGESAGEPAGEPDVDGLGGGAINSDDSTYEATVTWTEHGIPHVVAGNYASLGFGQGWAAASDRGCELADQVVKVRGERARHHGRGARDGHVHSDVAYAALDLRARAEVVWSRLSGDAQQLVEGYAAGFNAWVDDNGADALPGWCAGASWIPEVDALDLVAYHHDIAMVATIRPLLAAIATAAPPQPGDAPPAGTPLVPASPVVGGTAWALGSGATRAGVDPADDRAPAAMLVATSEFPWEGELALWENHLTIPGELDVYGLSLVGLPGVLSGFTDALAWTRLASPATRTVLVTVDVDGDNPTVYRIGDEVESMVPRPVAVPVLGPDGATTTEESTVWFTRHGPIVDLPGVGWGPGRAVALADVALANPVLVDEVLDTNRAGSADELVAAHRTRMASGWLATVAVTATGQAVYADPAGVPALAGGVVVGPGEGDDPLVVAAAQSGAVVVDGTATPRLWDTADASVSPVLVDGDRLARVVVDDWLVATGGATAWSSGGELVATGALPADVGAGTTPGPQLVGLVRLVEGLVVDATEEGRPLGPDDVIDVLATNEGTLSGALRDQVVERCRAAGPALVTAGTTVSGYGLWPAQEVDLGPVCNLLDRWEGRWNGEDQAPAVWTEFLSAFDPDELTGPGRLLATGWDPSDLVAASPSLAEAPERGPDPVAVALARAALAVEAAGFDIDDFWRDQFWTQRDDVAIGLRGSTGLDGTVLVGRPAGPSSSLSPAAALPVLVNPDSGLRIGGYQVRGGTSALMVVAFTPEGPDATALVVHGQSGDPASPYWADQAYRYSDLAWREVRTDPDDIAGAGERSVSLRVPRAP